MSKTTNETAQACNSETGTGFASTGAPGTPSAPSEAGATDTQSTLGATGISSSRPQRAGRRGCLVGTLIGVGLLLMALLSPLGAIACNAIVFEPGTPIGDALLVRDVSAAYGKDMQLVGHESEEHGGGLDWYITHAYQLRDPDGLEFTVSNTRYGDEGWFSSYLGAWYDAHRAERVTRAAGEFPGLTVFDGADAAAHGLSGDHAGAICIVAHDGRGFQNVARCVLSLQEATAPFPHAGARVLRERLSTYGADSCLVFMEGCPDEPVLSASPSRERNHFGTFQSADGSLLELDDATDGDANAAASASAGADTGASASEGAGATANVGANVNEDSHSSMSATGADASIPEGGPHAQTNAEPESAEPSDRAGASEEDVEQLLDRGFAYLVRADKLEGELTQSQLTTKAATVQRMQLDGADVIADGEDMHRAISLKPDWSISTIAWRLAEGQPGDYVLSMEDVFGDNPLDVVGYEPGGGSELVKRMVAAAGGTLEQTDEHELRWTVHGNAFTLSYDPDKFPRDQHPPEDKYRIVGPGGTRVVLDEPILAIPGVDDPAWPAPYLTLADFGQLFGVSAHVDQEQLAVVMHALE